MSSAVKKVRKSIRRARRQRTQAVNNAQALYQRGVGDINYIGAEVGDYLNKMNSNIRAGYDKTGSDMSAARAALQAQLAQGTEENAADASGELDRLGLSGVGLGGLQSDAAFQANLAKQQGVDEQANNTTAKANMGAIGELLLGMNQGQRQSALGKLLNARNDEITSVRERFREQRRDAMDTINEIRAQEAAARRRRSYSGGGGGGYYGGHGSGGGGSIYDQNQAAQLAINEFLNPPKKKTLTIPHNNWFQNWVFGK